MLMLYSTKRGTPQYVAPNHDIENPFFIFAGKFGPISHILLVFPTKS